MFAQKVKVVGILNSAENPYSAWYINGIFYFELEEVKKILADDGVATFDPITENITYHSKGDETTYTYPCVCVKINSKSVKLWHFTDWAFWVA